MGKTIIGREKKKVGLKRLLKYLQDLKKLDTFLCKPFDKVETLEQENYLLSTSLAALEDQMNKFFETDMDEAKKILKVVE